MPKQCLAKVIFNRELSPRYFHLRLAAGDLAALAQPGQFVQVKARPGWQPLLRTPLSVHDACPAEGWLDLLYRVLGESTALLSQASAGSDLDILGPLGHGFTLPEADRKAWLLAGGIGVAPLFLLARKLREQGTEIQLLYGARTAVELVRVAEFEQLGVEVKLASDDGSIGFRGNVVQLLRSLDLVGKCQLYACGPRPMLGAVDRFSVERGLLTELSLEEYMACGIGACLGCACATKEGGFAHVCTDGPVFRGGVVRL
jgi:dihydroorotate dehydrogenase electron transfer subunit